MDCGKGGGEGESVQGSSSAPPSARRALYGRRNARRLSPHRRQLLENVLPARRITLPVSPARLAPDGRVWLEIGFGGGEHLAEQARRHSDVAFIGCEAYRPGVAGLLSLMEAEALNNIRIHDGDGRDMLTALADGVIERLFILFPDPWPKARHHRRRMIAPAVIADIARVLADGGELRIAADLPEHVRWILSHLRRCPALEWTAQNPSGWRQRPADQPATRYERKALAAGRVPVYLTFRRVLRSRAHDHPASSDRASGPLSSLT